MLRHAQTFAVVMDLINLNNPKRVLLSLSSILFFTLILIVVCLKIFGSSEERAKNSKINDSSNLELSLVSEIGGKDGFLFGRISNAIVSANGTVIAADWKKLSLEQFDKNGRHIGTIASNGRGPGEIQSFFYIFLVDENSVIVSHDGAIDLINYYKRNENGVFTYSNSWLPKKNKKYFVDIVQAITKSKYYAFIKQKKLPIDEDYKKAQFTYKILSVVDKEKELISNELHELKEPNSIVDFEGGSMKYIGMPPFQSQDRFRYIDNGQYVIGRPDSSKLFFYDDNHNLFKTVYLQLDRERVTKEDIEYFFKSNSYSTENRSRIESRIPLFKPSFLNFWITKNKIYLNTDINEKGKEITMMNMKGEFIGIFFISKFDRIQEIKNDTIYTVYQHPNRGYRIRLYGIDNHPN